MTHPGLVLPIQATASAFTARAVMMCVVTYSIPHLKAQTTIGRRQVAQSKSRCKWTERLVSSGLPSDSSLAHFVLTRLYSLRARHALLPTAIIHDPAKTNTKWGSTDYPQVQSHVHPDKTVSYFDVQWDSSNADVGKVGHCRCLQHYFITHFSPNSTPILPCCSLCSSLSRTKTRIPAMAEQSMETSSVSAALQ